jgi:Holliday junction resolvase RusA-like endonuclease
MKLVLSLPPGINKTYGVNPESKVNKVYKRRVATDWEETAGYEIINQTAKSKTIFLGDVDVGIKWFYKYNRDIDSGLKILLDLFQKQHIYLNDRQVKRISYIELHKDLLNPRVEVEINEL